MGRHERIENRATSEPQASLKKGVVMGRIVYHETAFMAYRTDQDFCWHRVRGSSVIDEEELVKSIS